MLWPSAKAAIQLVILTWLAATSVGCYPKLPDQAELSAFAKEFKQANQASGIKPMLDLYELEGSTEQTVYMLRNALHFELGMPIESIQFLELGGKPEEDIHFVHNGQTYGPTLTPTYRMRVRYDTDDHFESTFTIGRNAANEYRIVSSRPIEAQP